MLVILGFAMVAVFMYLVMSKRATPIATLILVPLIFGAFTGAGLGMSDMVLDADLVLAPTAALLFFAIIFFGIMIDTGLFDPLVRLILRFVKGDPVRLVVGTALLTSIMSLDGDGSTTFIIVTSAMLPLYLRLGLSPVVLTVVAALANGVLNTVPWGGSTARAAAALGLSPIDIFVPMAPAILTALLAVIVIAYLLGLSERKRIGMLGTSEPQSSSSPGAPGHRVSDSDRSAGTGRGQTSLRTDSSERLGAEAPESQVDILDRPNARPKLIWVNLILVLAVMITLVAGVTEPAVIFMAATALALVVNFPRVKEQQEQIVAHSESVISVVGMVFAASVLTGVMSGTGMVDAMANWLVSIIPDGMGEFMPMIAGLLSIPLTFILTNDAFYFGMLPILAETASHFGIAPVEMARASLVGQALHQSSPLVASFLLLIGLAKVNLGDHFRKVLFRGIIVALVMLVAGGLFGAYTLF